MKRDLVRSIRQNMSEYVSIRQRCSAATRVTWCAAYVSIRQHTSAYGRVTKSRTARARSYVSIRQHSSAYGRVTKSRAASARSYVSIRQHTSAYVSIRQCCRYLLTQTPPQQLPADAPSTRRGRERCRFVFLKKLRLRDTYKVDDTCIEV